MTDAPNEQNVEGEIQRRVKIVNKRGLHARAAASFVKTVGEFDADITVHKGGNTVSGISIMGLMMLAAATDCHIDITATGPQAAEAMTALEQLIADRFGEE
jgi:phosphocarrier protein HPr